MEKVKLFDPSMSEGQSMYEETLADGTVVRHTKMHAVHHPKFQQGVEMVETEGPEREVVDYDEDEEILPDGTVHKTSVVRRHSLKHVKRHVKSESDEKEIFDGDIDVPGKERKEIVEVFEEPPTVVKDVEEIETVKDDGTIVKRKVVTSRVVHKIRTRSLSVDESGNIEAEEYTCDEIVPMTESAFAQDVTSSSSSNTVSSDSESDHEEQIPRVTRNPALSKETKMHVHFRSDEPGFEGDEILPEQDTDPPEILITEDNTEPPEEGSDVLAYFGIRNPDDDQPEGAEGGDVKTARMVMSKQIHTTTVLKDGKEHTTIHTETNVHEDDAPDDLRDSMQGIIDQFMEQPVEHEKPPSYETEI